MNYEIKLAQTDEELAMSYSIRYKVFLEELNFSSLEKYPDKREFDQYDTVSTTAHILTMMDGVAAGTARLIGPNIELAKANKSLLGFPMESLFSLWDFIRHQITAVEISRSAVAKEFRSSRIILDIWKTCILYGLKMQFSHLCTCAGSETDSWDDIQIVYRLLKDSGAIHPVIHTPPLEPSIIKKNPRFFLFPPDLKEKILSLPEGEPLPKDDIRLKLPVTLQYYLRLGGKVTGPPALYPEFQMYTLPMLFENLKLNEPYNTFVQKKSPYIHI